MKRSAGSADVWDLIGRYIDRQGGDNGLYLCISWYNQMQLETNIKFTVRDVFTRSGQNGD